MAGLDGKVCIITGATSGIGWRTAEVFVAAGARVVVAGRREAEGRASADQLGAACSFLRTAVTDEAQVRALVDFTAARHGRVDCLFNNAGGPAPPGGIATGMFGKVAGLSAETAERTVELAKAALAGMQPVPRAGLADDIAQAAVFLASDHSTFVNGHDLVVDGGLIGGQRWSQQQERLRAMRSAFLTQQG